PRRRCEQKSRSEESTLTGAGRLGAPARRASVRRLRLGAPQVIDPRTRSTLQNAPNGTRPENRGRRSPERPQPRHPPSLRPARSPSGAPTAGGGQRRYPAEALRRIKVVQAALAIGFTLKELAWAFGERRAGRPPCRRVHALARDKLADLDARLLELGRVRDSLSEALVVWERRLAAGEPAGLLQALGDLELSGRALHTPRRRSR